MLAEVFVAALAGLVAGLVALVTLVAYARSRHPRLAFVGSALGVLAGRGAWQATSLVLPDRLAPLTLSTGVVMDLAIAVLLYLAVLQPTRG